MTTKSILTFALAAVLAGGVALADDMPNLPQAIKLPQSADSPGVVTFNHDMHVETGNPGCLNCHPRRFSILGRSAATKEAKITHAAMEKGESCGACHGKKAFNFDDCTMCHAM